MKHLFVIAVICLSVVAASGQGRMVPAGSSKFIKTFGGLFTEDPTASYFHKLTEGKVDQVYFDTEGEDWNEINGRIFLTRKWSIEIGEVSDDLIYADLEEGIEAAMRKMLQAEGLTLNQRPRSISFSPIRYQKGTTTGSLEFTVCDVAGNDPRFVMIFTFYESYLKTSRPAERLPQPKVKKEIKPRPPARKQ